MKGPFLHFDHVGSTGKTDRWNVVSLMSSTTLGMIAWYAPWRRYAFSPYPNTLFDAACLREVATFIDVEMKKRKDAQ